MLCTALVSCTSSNKEEVSTQSGVKAKKPPNSQFFKIGITQEFDSMNPLIMQMSASGYIYRMVGRTLVVLNSKNQWVPQLAKEIPSVENKKVTFFTEKGVKKIKSEWEILENAKWGDGVDVTGHDVEFSWKTARLDTVPVGEKEVYNQIEKIIVDKTNPKKFTFIYKKAKYDFYQLGSFYIVPKHIEESVVEKYGSKQEGYSKNSNYSLNMTNPGLYNGPYVIKDIKRGSHITVAKNPYFYGESPTIDNLIIKIIANTGTLEANLRSNTIDMISFIGFTLDQALQFRKKVQKNKLPYHVNIRPSLIYEHIDLNLRNEILKDIRVRKALVYAIDRDQLTKALFEGIQKKAIHNISPQDPWYTDNPQKIVLYPTSKTKSKELLEKAGWKLKEDGYRYKDGKKLKLTIMTTAGDKTREMVQVFLQREWKQVGIDLNIKNEVAKIFFGETIKKRQNDKPILSMFAWLSSPETSPRSQFSTKSIPSKENSYSGQNYTHWKNKEVDQLIEKLEVEFNAEKRKDIMAKILYHYTNEVPVIPLYYRSDISVTPKNLIGYRLNGNQYPTTNFIEDWRFVAH